MASKRSEEGADSSYVPVEAKDFDRYSLTSSNGLYNLFAAWQKQAWEISVEEIEVNKEFSMSLLEPTNPGTPVDLEKAVFAMEEAELVTQELNGHRDTEKKRRRKRSKANGWTNPKSARKRKRLDSASDSINGRQGYSPSDSDSTDTDDCIHAHKKRKRITISDSDPDSDTTPTITLSAMRETLTRPSNCMSIQNLITTTPASQFYENAMSAPPHYKGHLQDNGTSSMPRIAKDVVGDSPVVRKKKRGPLRYKDQVELLDGGDNTPPSSRSGK